MCPTNRKEVLIYVFAFLVIVQVTKTAHLLVLLQNMVSGMSHLDTKNIPHIKEYLIIISEK